MKKNYEILFTPARIGKCEIKNRFVMEPMEGTTVVNWVTPKGYDPGVHDMLIERAKDGIGLIIPGAIFIYSLFGDEWVYQHPESFDGVAGLMDEIHKYGSKCFFQLSAGVGRNAPIPKHFHDDYQELNPSLRIDKTIASADDGLPEVWCPDLKTKALTAEEIEHIIYAMAETAWLCKQNGVDGVDVHAVHEGYLLDQFATKYTNHRTDKYGGSLDNRLRFACEVVKAIKKRCGDDYPVTLRYSITSRTRDFNKGIIPEDNKSVEIGRTLEEAVETTRILADAGYDGFNTDNGTYDAWYYAHPPVYMPLNCNLKESEFIKPYTDKPIICAGRMQLDEAAASIAAGTLDMVGIARQFLTDPEYLTKIREDRLEDIRPCIACHVGCFPVGLYKDSCAAWNPAKPLGICALNPYTRNEKKYMIRKSSNPRRVAVIGGGIAGMEFAVRASQSGHTVDLYEKSNVLGGVFIPAASFSFKEKDRDLIRFYRTQIEKSSVRVHLNHNVTSLDEIEADDFVIATGSLNAKKLPGASEKAVSAVEFLNGGIASCPDRTAIIGGGLTGCEIAYELAKMGKHPFIVEMMDDILKIPGSCMANTNFLRDAFDYYEVERYVSAKTKEIADDYVTIVLADGEEKKLPMDICIVSIGYQQGIPFDIPAGAENVHVIGDAGHVSNLMNAIWGANDLLVEKFM